MEGNGGTPLNGSGSNCPGCALMRFWTDHPGADITIGSPGPSEGPGPQYAWACVLVVDGRAFTAQADDVHDAIFGAIGDAEIAYG